MNKTCQYIGLRLKKEEHKRTHAQAQTRAKGRDEKKKTAGKSVEVRITAFCLGKKGGKK